MVRLGLLGPLDFLHGQAQAQKRLVSLYAQDSVHVSFQARVAEFGRCALCPFLILRTSDDADRGFEENEDEGLANPDGAPLILRCEPYVIGISQLLTAITCSENDFFRQWSALPATGNFWVKLASSEERLLKGISAFSRLSAQAYDEDSTLSMQMRTCWDNQSVALVCVLEKHGVDAIVVCLNAKTCEGEVVSIMIIAQLSTSTEDSHMRFLVRASKQVVVDVISEELDDW